MSTRVISTLQHYSILPAWDHIPDSAGEGVSLAACLHRPSPPAPEGWDKDINTIKANIHIMSIITPLSVTHHTLHLRNLHALHPDTLVRLLWISQEDW